MRARRSLSRVGELLFCAVMLVAATTAACSGNGASAPAKDDQSVLLKAKDELVGDAELNWGPSAELNAWEGVTVDSDSERVVGLSLRTRGLNGQIPAVLGELSMLRVLSLSGNDLSGEIPKEIGELAELETLTLSTNTLSGSIPNELGNLVNLTALSLNGNKLTGPIPTELTELTALQSLQLHDNQLSGEVPEALSDLEHLRLVRLSGNQFQGCVPRQLLLVEVHDLVESAIPTCELGRPQLTPFPPISDICFDDAVIPKMMQIGEVAGQGFTFDCRTLLQAKASMPSSCDLNWGPDTPFVEWDGVHVRLGSPPFYQDSKVMGLELPWDCVSNGLPKVLDDLTGYRFIAVSRSTEGPFNDIPSDWVPEVDSGEIVAEELKEFGIECVRFVVYKTTDIDYLVTVVSGCGMSE